MIERDFERLHRGLSKARIEEIAQDARQMLLEHHLHDCASVPCDKVFERLDDLRLARLKKLGLTPYGDIADVFAKEEGCTYVDLDDATIVLALPEKTYRKLKVGDGRSRFTFAHEFGHILLHAELLVARAVLAIERPGALNMVDLKPRPIFQNPEWQANQFAGALLMPFPGLRKLESIGKLTPDDLCQTFGVSRLAAEIRIEAYQDYGKEYLVKQRGEYQGGPVKIGDLLR